MAKLWGGRFQKEFTTDVEEFNQSVNVDERMIYEDIWGSQAHALMLAKQKIISDEDLKIIIYWLDKAKKDFLEGKFKLNKGDEDVHMNVEKYIIKGAGEEYGGKLHTARSRNDQVLVDSKLHIRQRIISVQRKILKLQEKFIEIARKNIDTPMPGYTHTQVAQPISLAYWATAYVSMFERDVARLDDSYKVVDMNPLGACALAGTSFNIDRKFTSKLLGFSKVHEHGLDVISSRDFIAQTLCSLTLLMVNISKLSEEIVSFSTYEFGMFELDDSYSSGSSIMPQKKNADVAELSRAKSGRVIGSLVQILTMLKGLPMGYNKDLQEDKPPLWNSFDDLDITLDVMAGMVSTIKFKKDRMLELSGANFSTATELANYLVRDEGISFRLAHKITGTLVAELNAAGKNFDDLGLICDLLSKQDIKVNAGKLKQILDPKMNLSTYRSLGSSSPKQVEIMLKSQVNQIKINKSKINGKVRIIEEAKKLTESMCKKILKGQKAYNLKV